MPDGRQTQRSLRLWLWLTKLQTRGPELSKKAVNYFFNLLTKRVPNLLCIQVIQGLDTLGNVYNLARFADKVDIKDIKEENTFYSSNK